MTPEESGKPIMLSAVVHPPRRRRFHHSHRVRRIGAVLLVGAGIIGVALAIYWIGIGACAPPP
ncbi:MAG: hypothetical protein J5J06_01855 [Phycisphaerae bacterium]|nr:hypothetical protein [Phycisphaerae bacterium]